MGAEFATQLAAQKLNLVLVARRTDEMQTLVEKLTSTYAIQARTISLDLSHSDAASICDCYDGAHDEQHVLKQQSLNAKIPYR
ncbi:MAG: hypothetical protein HZB51_09355 [Chloroflexi bacterium]|nr:hypothetical protein [Chloroflexota bacterium]